MERKEKIDKQTEQKNNNWNNSIAIQKQFVCNLSLNSCVENHWQTFHKQTHEVYHHRQQQKKITRNTEIILRKEKLPVFIQSFLFLSYFHCHRKNKKFPIWNNFSQILFWEFENIQSVLKTLHERWQILYVLFSIFVFKFRVKGCRVSGLVRTRIFSPFLFKTKGIKNTKNIFSDTNFNISTGLNFMTLSLSLSLSSIVNTRLIQTLAHTDSLKFPSPNRCLFRTLQLWTLPSPKGHFKIESWAFTFFLPPTKNNSWALNSQS